MAADLARIGLTSCALYALPTVCSYLSTRPSRSSLESRVDRLRERFATLKEKVANFVGERRFSFCSEVVANYAWVSFLVVSVFMLLSKQPLTTREGRRSSLDILNWCLAAGILRREIAWLVSFLERHLGLAGLRDEVLAERTAVAERQFCENLINFLRSHQGDFGLARESQERFNFLAFREIPEPLHADALLKRYTCPITQRPIRYPVMDPNGNAIYEREAILSWLETHGTSPVTSRPLHARDLVLKSDLKQMIDSRLRFHGERLQNYIWQNGDARGSFEAPNVLAPVSFTFNAAIPQHLLFSEERELQRSSSVRAAVVGSTLGAVNTRPLYERLAEFLQSRLDELKKDPQGKFSLVDLEEIPEPLHEDAFFSRHICPITQMPIRNPTGDSNGTIVYERQAIESWLGVHRTSPMTRAPFLVTKYFLACNLRDRINCRLRFHEKRLRSFFQKKRQARKAFTGLYDALFKGSLIDCDPNFENRYLQGFNLVQQARGIEDLDCIPEPFADDSFLQEWRCPITQRPIRYIVVVDSTREDEKPVFYERSAIMEWINNRPGELPPRWPETVEYTAEHLEDFRRDQLLINSRLQRLLNDREFMDIIEQTVSEWDL